MWDNALVFFKRCSVWFRSMTNLCLYRLKAAWLGLRVSWHSLSVYGLFDLASFFLALFFGAASLFFALVSALLAIFIPIWQADHSRNPVKDRVLYLWSLMDDIVYLVSSRVSLFCASLLFLLFVWGIMRWLGSLRRIMKVSSKCRGEALDEVRDRIRLGSSYTQIYDVMRELYVDDIKSVNSIWDEPEGKGWELLDISGKKYACAYYQLDKQNLSGILNYTAPYIQDNDVLSIVNAKERQQLVKSAQEQDKNLRDIEEGDNFCAVNIRKSGHQVIIDTKIARYGQIMRTCDSLVEELFLFSGIKGESPMLAKHTIKCLYWRRRLMRKYKKQKRNFLIHGDWRAAGIGVSALTVFATKQGYEVVFAKRSNAVGTYPNTYHVVPTGMCNTRDIQERDISKFLWTCICSEFLEEILGLDEFEDYKGSNWLESVITRMEQELSKPTSKTWELLLNGIAIDLINLRPEICTTLIIHDKKIAERIRKKERPNWEIKQLTRNVDINSLSPKTTVPIGAAAYWLGTEKVFTKKA